MTELRFRITPGVIPQPLLEKTYFASWGRATRPTRVDFEDGEMILRAEAKGSGTVHVLWPHRQLGLVVESTDSLLPQARPYHLVRELGRGALGRLMRKMFEWQLSGFHPPQDLSTRIMACSRYFSKVVVSDPADPEVDRELSVVLEEIDQVSQEATRLFTEQSIAWRMRNNEKLPVLFGVGMHMHPLDTLYEFDLYAKYLQEAFHAVLPMPCWRELEPEPDLFRWDLLERRLSIPARYGFQVVMGPLLCFDTATFPAWLSVRLGEEGFFESRATRFVNAVTERYGSQAAYWILANRFNSYSIKEIPLPRALMLIRILAQQIRSRGIETPILIGIDRPWGEYALGQAPEYDLVQIAESLMGTHEIDAFLMELNFGLDNRSTFPRDPMAISSMIDQWSFLGKKVYVSLSVPSSIGEPPSEADMALAPELQWSEGMQQSWTEMLLNTMLGKRMVQGIFWSLLQDPEENPDDTKSLGSFAPPFAGLIDSSRILKLAFKQFSAIRKAMLK